MTATKQYHDPKVGDRWESGPIYEIIEIRQTTRPDRRRTVKMRNLASGRVFWTSPGQLYASYRKVPA